MVSPSRKLTVSFGAFACTLEGFDDPFPIMRQVVDYFQALASADPSFGAHPERPDTDYLKTLAQDSAGGSVQAELSDGGMILRQTSDDTSETTFDQVDSQFAKTETALHRSADELMAVALTEMRFEDVDTSLESEFYGEDLEAEAVQIEEVSDGHGASLPDWTKDLMADAQEHGFETETQQDAEQHVDPIAREEAALERVLEAAEQRNQVKPELEQNNPLARLRAEIETESKAEISEPNPPLEEAQIDDIFRAFADTSPLKEDGPLSAASVLRAEEQIGEETNPQNNNHLVTTAASTKVSSRAMRLRFDGSIPKPAELSKQLDSANTSNSTAPIQASAQPKPQAAVVDPEPLILMKSQKVDEPTEMNLLSNEAPTQTQTSMAQSDARTDAFDDVNTFASSVGAASLPQLLEASAAYVTLVSGQSTFSRRDIMSTLDGIHSDREYSQEARIKSFGKLLRGGTILRTGDGQFAISDRALTAYEDIAGVA